MTKVVSVVRLIPSEEKLVGCREYCAQIFIPELGLPWKNVGNVIIDEFGYKWRSVDSFASLLPSIEVTAAELYADFSNRFDPYLFARYKIRKYVDELISGELPSDTVVPSVFSEVDAAERPVFFGIG